MAGTTVSYWEDNISVTLATVTNYIHYALINLGVNDVTAGLPDETTWKANYQTIIDAFKADWPGIKVYITKPWKRGFDTEVTALAGWIDDLVAANAGVCFVADNESTWLKGADDGVTMTTDGVHYSVAGNAEKINQMITVFGY